MIMFNLGTNFLLSGEKEEADKFFHKVLELNPSHSQALYNLATIMYDRADFGGALAYYGQAP